MAADSGDRNPSSPSHKWTYEQEEAVRDSPGYEVALLAFGPKGPTAADLNRPIAIRHKKRVLPPNVTPPSE